MSLESLISLLDSNTKESRAEEEFKKEFEFLLEMVRKLYTQRSADFDGLSPKTILDNLFGVNGGGPYNITVLETQKLLSQNGLSKKFLEWHPLFNGAISVALYSFDYEQKKVIIYFYQEILEAQQDVMK